MHSRSKYQIILGDTVQDAVITYEGDKAVTVYDNSDPYWCDKVGRFAAGEYDLTHAKHYWYLRDRLGSTVAVIDASTDRLHIKQLSIFR